MFFLLMAISIAALTLGHYFKVLRWNQFISIYEDTQHSLLYRALAVGYLLNIFLPFRIGDFVRAWISGARLKNGVSFSIATILVDHVLDIPIVLVIFLLIRGWYLPTLNSSSSEFFYGALVLFIIFFVTFLSAIKAPLKYFSLRCCSIFNSQIEFSILFFLWGLITSTKDIVSKISLKRLFVYTVGMWFFYLLSIALVVRAIASLGLDLGFSHLYSFLFSGSALTSSVAFSYFLSSSKSLTIFAVVVGYLTLPLIFILCAPSISRLLRLGANDSFTQLEISSDSVCSQNLLPQINEKDRLLFLRKYFANSEKNFLLKYLEINSDIQIIQDYSAGSNATTILAINQKETFYRKYAIGIDAAKLENQVDWILRYQLTLSLPAILAVQVAGDFCRYDMPYKSSSIGFFNYIHSHKPELSWGILEAVLSDLENCLYVPTSRAQDGQKLDDYLSMKVDQNIEKIQESTEIRAIMEYETIFVNGIEYQNLRALRKWLSKDILTKVFSVDELAEVHGDLTIENIICNDDGELHSYYLIDPNGGNLHETPFLDYAKLLQSLHGGYEFLVHTDSVQVVKNRITFQHTRSENYKELFDRYHKFLQEKFSPSQVRSIFFHEIVHWLRLMPYKTQNSGKKSLVFYAVFIKVFNEIIEWYGDFEKE